MPKLKEKETSQTFVAIVSLILIPQCKCHTRIALPLKRAARIISSYVLHLKACELAKYRLLILLLVSILKLIFGFLRKFVRTSKL